jgi:hypothetical protein
MAAGRNVYLTLNLIIIIIEPLEDGMKKAHELTYKLLSKITHIMAV